MQVPQCFNVSVHPGTTVSESHSRAQSFLTNELGSAQIRISKMSALVVLLSVKSLG